MTMRDAAIRLICAQRVMASRYAYYSFHLERSIAQNPSDTTVPSKDDHPTPSSSSLPGWLKGPQMRQSTPLAEDWVDAIDSQTGEKCWRSNVTGEFTRPGLTKPHTWHEVVDKGSGLLYYWCPATGETTLVGEPRPGALGRHASYTLDHQEPERGAATAAKGEEQELSIFSMYNNPLGYLLLGMAVFGIISQNLK